jgi:hypothetical protein
MKINGYELTTTGGNCTALEKDLGGAEGKHVVIMLTEIDDPREPEGFPLYAGVYTENGYDHDSGAEIDSPEMLEGFEKGVRARFGL